MAEATAVKLNDHFASFVDAQVSAGRYDSADEVVKAGLRLLEEREAKLSALRAAIEEGEASGAPVPFDIDVELHLLNEQEVKLDTLRQALIEGEQSGPSTAFDFDAFIARKRAGHDRTP